MNIEGNPTSIRPAAPVPRRPLAIVYVAMAAIALAIAAVLEVGGLRSPEIADAGPVPFLLAVIAGALAAWAASFGAGVVGGMLTGFAYGIGGGIVQAFAPGSAMPLPAVVTAVFLMTILGAMFGGVGAIPFAIIRWRQKKKLAWNGRTRNG